MISFREADLIDKIKQQEQNDLAFDTPTNGLNQKSPADKMPFEEHDLLGESVYVKDSEDHGQDSDWYGRVKSYNSITKLYTIEDKVGDTYTMTRDRFETQ